MVYHLVHFCSCENTRWMDIKSSKNNLYTKHIRNDSYLQADKHRVKISIYKKSMSYFNIHHIFSGKLFLVLHVASECVALSKWFFNIDKCVNLTKTVRRLVEIMTIIISREKIFHDSIVYCYRVSQSRVSYYYFIATKCLQFIICIEEQ